MSSASCPSPGELQISMATTLIPPEPVPVLEKEAPLSDHRGNGSGFGGDFDDGPGGPFDPHEFPGELLVPVPRGVYRAGMLVGIASVVCLFATLSTVLRLRWLHSKNWVSIALLHTARSIGTPPCSF